MSTPRALSLIIAVLVFAMSIGSTLAADCASAPVHGDRGEYHGCEIVHGDDVELKDVESVPEKACAHVCDSISEIDAMAAESRELDIKAGLGG